MLFFDKRLKPLHVVNALPRVTKNESVRCVHEMSLEFLLQHENKQKDKAVCIFDAVVPETNKQNPSYRIINFVMRRKVK